MHYIHFKAWVMAMAVIALMVSCKKQTAHSPEMLSVNAVEVGPNNSKVAYTASDLHLAARMIAPGKIAGIKVQITLDETNYGWDFVKTYTSPYAGQKNADFHEHIAVPENARPGKYTLLMVVADESGGKAQGKAGFEIIRDLSLPRVSNASLISSGAILNFSGLIEASNKISRLVIEVQSSTWARTFTDTAPDMVDQARYQVNKDIDLSAAPAGHYHVNVTVFDKVGKQALYAYHFDK
ncbi:hypothetical protein C7T94_14195 [Pedobacter yulinensis]|uniref:DUF4625 domain-containing protein n=1 Tax=Pedobacter yulinensis TaxID=2126353 RepID=A0A2T3HMJ5_9SPHI|nr:DUF4625 domain-containing protein [Pedobacter yulinensis]PST83678.1 hypothetical protein C7T94_14195 [Pedobacter yulinensis]